MGILVLIGILWGTTLVAIPHLIVTGSLILRSTPSLAEKVGSEGIV